MEHKEFLKRLRAYAKRTGQDYAFDQKRGKGSHGRITVGNHFTTIKKGAFGPGLLHKMLNDLNIDKKDF